MLSSPLILASVVTFQQPQSWTYTPGKLDAQQQIALDVYKELV